MLAACHAHASTEFTNCVGNAFVVSGYNDGGQITRPTGPFPHMLQHWFTGNKGKRFSGEASRGKSGGDNTENPRPHN